MAKKHVFPVCQNGGSKTYVAKDKKEGGRSIIDGNDNYYETEDPDVIGAEGSASNYLNQYFFLSKDKTEYLIDHTEAPETDLAVTQGTEYVVPYFAHQDLNGPYTDLWLEINNKQRGDVAPVPGSIICIGRKNNSEATWKAFTTLFLWIYFGYNDPRNTAPFNDESAIFISNKFDNQRIEDGEWVTYMWSGTRFVLLGSNNWY